MIIGEFVILQNIAKINLLVRLTLELKESKSQFSVKDCEICGIWFPREINKSYQSSFFFGLTQKKFLFPSSLLLMISIQMTVNDLPPPPHWSRIESLYRNASNKRPLELTARSSWVNWPRDWNVKFYPFSKASNGLN